MKLGLDNVAGFLHDMGQPQIRFPSIHISGTNGKGSTATMLAAILQQAGYRVGLFTSPHLVSLRERIRVDGNMIHKRSVTSFIDRHRNELTRRKISFFELLAAMAFDRFARARVDYAVVEVGLGGRLDATNVLNPILTITTDISRDHVEFLGETYPQIAWEKAGIVKPGVPHVTGLLPVEALKSQRAVCHERQAPFHVLNRKDFIIDEVANRLDFQDGHLQLKRLAVALQGRHQLTNAACAIKSLSVLRQLGVRISQKSIRAGLKQIVWPGRFQQMRLKGGPLVVLDVGHNEKGVQAFVKTFRKAYPGRRARIVTGFVKRKPHQMMIDILRPITADFSIVRLATARSVDLRELVADTDFGSTPYRVFRSLTAAWRQVLPEADPDDIIVVVGSHYLVGEFLEKYGQT